MGEQRYTGEERAWVTAVTEMANVARRALEPGLQKDARGTAISAGACLHAAVLLAELIGKFGNGQVVVRGGSGENGTGALDTEGRFQGHYWVEASWGDVVLAADITGDQFGHASVRVLGLDEARGVLRPGEQSVVDTAADELRLELGMGVR